MTGFTHRPKSFPATARGLDLDQVREQRWSLLTDFATPICSISESALTHNLNAMAGHCARNGFEHAPHGKTTMSPELITRQLDAGAWAITAATPWQAEQMISWGVRRVVLANVCANPRPLHDLLTLDAEVITFVDSAETVALTAAAVPDDQVLPVLIEVGAPGGRCGVRTITSGLTVAETVAAEPRLRLAGVAAFEGTVTGRGDAAVTAVRNLLTVVRGLAEQLQTELDPAYPMIVSAGGSMYPDLVINELTRPWPRPTRVLLRSGCYLTHDHRLYAESAPLEPVLRPAMRVWSRVLSVPEPGWAIIDAGKRDLTVDPPARVLAIHRDGATRQVDLSLDHHNDQHGYIRFTDEDLRVGDICELGISHPCLTFDRWTHIPLIDDDLTVTGVVRTCF